MVMLVDIKVFLCIYMGNNIKDNLEKKTREVVDIRMSNFDWNFLQL